MTLTTAAPLAALAPGMMSFDEASEKVLDYLRSLLPMDFWTVSAYDREGERQVYLHVSATSRGRRPSATSSRGRTRSASTWSRARRRWWPPTPRRCRSTRR